MYENAKGPVILLDAAHHNVHVTEGFIDPFAELAASDGYQAIVGNSRFTPESFPEDGIAALSINFDVSKRLVAGPVVAELDLAPRA